MNVIFHTANLNGSHPIRAGDAAKKRPEAFAQFRRDKGPTLFGAEDAMVVRANVGHAESQPSLRDLGNRKQQPNLERLGYCQPSLRDETLRIRVKRPLELELGV